MNEVKLLGWMKLQPFDVHEWFSVNKNYTSMFVFTSRKQQ